MTKKTISVKVDSKLYSEASEVLKSRGTDLETWIRLQLRAFAKGGKRLLSLTDKMSNGKYNGELVEDVCRADTRYAAWMLAQDFSVKYDSDVHALVAQLLQAA